MYGRILCPVAVVSICPLNDRKDPYTVSCHIQEIKTLGVQQFVCQGPCLNPLGEIEPPHPAEKNNRFVGNLSYLRKLSGMQ